MGWGVGLFKNATGQVRWGWVVVLFAALAVLGELLSVVIFMNLSLVGTRFSAASDVFLTLPALMAGGLATVVCRKVTGEPAVLADARALQRAGLGILAGGSAVTAACAVPWLINRTELALNPEWSFSQFSLGALALAPAAFGEELLLRGLGLQALRRGIGDTAAVIVSSLMFGALHLSNPHASWVAALIITLVGLWFGLTMTRTGSLFASIGLHLGWNFFEGSVLGQPVSGVLPVSPLLIAPWPSEQGWWSGGPFGPEAQGWTVVVLAMAFALTWWRVRSGPRIQGAP